MVLYNVKKGRYYTADPAKGLIVYTGKEFKQN
ncbi:MAG: hypothetical protein WC380_12300 [Pedobacter sp.]